MHKLKLWIITFVLLFASVAAAQGSGAQKQANEHFRRAVDLYNEADYRGALVEFKRAYELAPNSTVLYNIGQSHYQLTEYARALDMFERYLASDANTHRSEVEQTVAVLKARVGKLDISCSRGWEVTVDEEPPAKCPLEAPMRAGVGRHKVTAERAGKPPITKLVEVVAGETAAVVLTPDGETAAPAGKPKTSPTKAKKPVTESSSRDTWLTVGWIATGVFAAGALVTGANALSESRRLQDERKKYPGDSDEIEKHSKRTTQFALVADVLGAAAVVTGAVTLTVTLSGGKSDEGQVGASMRLNGSF